MTRVVISQPMLFPWPGFFELVASADIYVHLDDVQFSKGSFTNRVQIKTAADTKWMTIPLQGKGSFARISELKASGSAWKTQHRRLVEQALAGAPYLSAALEIIDVVYSKEPPLVELLKASIEMPAAAVGVGPSLWPLASGLGIGGSSSERVLGIVRAMGGTRYVTAHGAARYLDHTAFEEAGVAVEYVDYSLTNYPQSHGAFTPFVSILDVIAQLGQNAGSVLRPRTVSWREFLARKTTP
jgi:hypothetical protein